MPPWGCFLGIFALCTSGDFARYLAKELNAFPGQQSACCFSSLARQVLKAAVLERMPVAAKWDPHFSKRFKDYAKQACAWLWLCMVYKWCSRCSLKSAIQCQVQNFSRSEMLLKTLWSRLDGRDAGSNLAHPTCSTWLPECFSDVYGLLCAAVGVDSTGCYNLA